jgi:PAS domain S-box-containing protein
VNWLSRTAQWLGGVYLLFAAIASFRESQLPLLPPEKQSQSAYYREAIAVAVVLAAAAIRLAFLSALGMHAPFITFYPAVMFASIYGGLRAGLLATALSALLADYFWIEPAGRFTIGQPADWLGLVIFVLSGAMISWIADEMHRARARAAAAEAVREMQRETEFLANLLERSSQAFAVGYADGRLGRFNHAYERLTGYTAADLRALDWSATLTPPEWRELEKQQLDNLRRTGQPVRYEKEYIRKDGSHVPIELLVHLARDAGGNPEYYYAFVTDITGRKRAEIALRQSEERYRTLFNMLMEGFCIIKVVFDSDNTPVDYRFLECNPAFEAQTGLQNAQGKLMRELAPDHEAHWFEIYGKVALTGEAARFENEARALNRWYDVYAYRIGRPEDHHVAIIFNDITDRKREEERIRRHADSLRAKNEELERVNRVMVGRELRMIELKKEVNELCVRAGLQPPYQIDSERAQS